MKKEQKKYKHDDLVALYQDGKITVCEFVYMQEDLRSDYLAFLEHKDLDKNDESANAFLAYYENNVVMNNIENGTEY